MAGIKVVSGEEKKSVSDVLGGLLVKYRVVIIGLVVALILAAVGIAAGLAISEGVRTKGLTEFDTLTESLVSARSELTGDALSAKEDEILSSLDGLVSKNSRNVVGVRASMLKAEIYFAREDWASAKDAWIKASDIDSKAYTAPLCLYNAAVSSEELGDLDGAVTLLGKVVENTDFSLRQEALFSLGRIEDQRGNYAAAVEQYEKMLAEQPNDSWTLLAHSRILQLQAEGKAE
ncbi:MAG: tetratricopeptide repeat protein [Spirochaetaceae bacterium]|jgi:tetratricopeptide (TPR) repeat protein|nr:tetratricopeptide repeat protein [Spirochaetaceae bacterium]